MNIESKVLLIQHLGIPMPDNMEFGDDCIHGHGSERGAVRYKKNGKCVVCVALKKANKELTDDQESDMRAIKLNEKIRKKDDKIKLAADHFDQVSADKKDYDLGWA